MILPTINSVVPAPTPAIPAQTPLNAPNAVLPTSGLNLLIYVPALPGTMTLNWTSPPVMPATTPAKHAPMVHNVPVAKPTTLESTMTSVIYASVWEDFSIQVRNSAHHADTHV